MKTLTRQLIVLWDRRLKGLNTLVIIYKNRVRNIRVQNMIIEINQTQVRNWNKFNFTIYLTVKKSKFSQYTRQVYDSKLIIQAFEFLLPNKFYPNRFTKTSILVLRYFSLDFKIFKWNILNQNTNNMHPQTNVLFWKFLCRK